MDDPHHRRPAAELDTLSRPLASRRQALKLLGAAGLVPVVGCGGASSSGSGADADGAGSGDGAGDGSCSAIPAETAGPFPGDGSNGADALALSGIVRSDIRSSIAGATGTAEGVPLTITLTLVDARRGCAPLAGHAIYVWHCDRDADYSMYTGAAAAQNYLRGVQAADASGQLTFTAVFPGCYPGRWPHIHFAVYASLEAATTGAEALHTSQLALPEAACREVYASAGYEASLANLGGTSLDSDVVFADGASDQIAGLSGDVGAGFAASLTIGLEI
jgi:protocatechuate 3,4-dioxygenase beta subunit